MLEWDAQYADSTAVARTDRSTDGHHTVACTRRNLNEPRLFVFFRHCSHHALRGAVNTKPMPSPGTGGAGANHPSSRGPCAEQEDSHHLRRQLCVRLRNLMR